MVVALATSELNLMHLTVGLFGGLSLFLFGMDQMTTSLKAVAGDGMRSILGRFTKNRFAAALTGAFVTAIIQSSSVTTVLVVGFISAGLMTLSQSVGVILGANIGTTITAQIIAFKVTKAALVLITIGFGVSFLSKKDSLQQAGTLIMGLGMIFFGMTLMSEATDPLRTYDPFIQVMQSISRPILAMAVAALFTALVQSSSATTGIVIVLASQGFITLEAGIALALGANVGTCVTALLAALGKPRQAMQAATVHVLFNIVGMLIWIGLIPYLAEFVRIISPGSIDLQGVDRLAADTPRQIANAHTAFNVANTLLFILFTKQIAWVVTKLVPIPPPTLPDRAKPKYLEDVYLQTPTIAIDRVQLEIGRLGKLVDEVADAVTRVDGIQKIRVQKRPIEIEALYEAIIGYSRRLYSGKLSSAETARLEQLLAAANHMVSIADTIKLNLGSLAHEARARGLRASEQTREKFRVLSGEVNRAIRDASHAVRENDHALAREVVARKREITRLSDDLAHHLGDRLASDDPNRLALYRLESDVIEILKRLFYFAKRIAKTVATDIEE